MTAILQLKTIREEAMERLAQNEDYRLVSKLDELISEIDVTTAAVDTTTNYLDAQEDIATAVDTLAEDRITSDINDKFDALSNDFCATVREESTHNGSVSH